MTNINWDVKFRFDPNSPEPFATHGVPVPVYGNYGGPGWSAGEVNGTAPPPPNPVPAPLDGLDTAFYWHDRAYQSSQDPLVRLAADVELITFMQALPDAGEDGYDPEANLYAAFATLGIVAGYAVNDADLPAQIMNLMTEATEEALDNFEAGLEDIPAEARSLHGAFHLFQARYSDLVSDWLVA